MKNGKYKEDEKICWYKNGQLHREDGPAIMDIFADQIHYYWHGKKVTKLQHDLLIAQKHLTDCYNRASQSSKAV